jgi:hypothetical protein
MAATPAIAAQRPTVTVISRESTTRVDHPGLQAKKHYITIDRDGRTATVNLFRQTWLPGWYIGTVNAHVRVNQSGRIAAADAKTLDDSDRQGIIKQLTGITLSQLLQDVRLP